MRDISDFFLLIFLLSLFALVSGFISPKLVLWIWGERNKTRKEVLRYFGTTAVVLFFLYGMSTTVFRPKHMKEPEKSVQQVENQNEAVDTVYTMMPSGNIRVATKLLKRFTESYGGAGNPKYSTPSWLMTVGIYVGRSHVVVKTYIYPSPGNKIGIAQDTCRQILSLLYDDDPDYFPLDTVEVEGQYDRFTENYVLLTWCYKQKRR